MKKHLLFLVVLIISFQNLFAQKCVVQNSGVDALLRKVHFVNENTGWIVGVDKLVLKTENGGKTWSPQKFNTSIGNYSQMVFADEKTGWLLGNSGMVKTMDGGKIWKDTDLLISNPSMGNGFEFVDQKTGWAFINDNGKSLIYKTTNGGLNWDVQFDTVSIIYNFVDNGYIATMNFIHSISFVDPKTGWVLLCEKLLKTTDGGNTWNHQEQNIPIPKTNSKDPSDDLHFNQVLFLNKSVGWLTMNNTIFKTIDGGETWKTYPFDRHLYYGMLHFVDEKTGIVLGDTMAITKNGGKNWDVLFHQDSTRIWDVSIVNHEKAWAVGENGLIVNFSIDESTGILEEVTRLYYPAQIKLYPNYPNPFNPSTTIRFHLTQSQNVQLRIFNIHGQEIRTLVNDVVSAGEHSVQWHADDLPAGIYLARLQAGAQIETRKLILQK